MTLNGEGAAALAPATSADTTRHPLHGTPTQAATSLEQLQAGSDTPLAPWWLSSSMTKAFLLKEPTSIQESQTIPVPAATNVQPDQSIRAVVAVAQDEAFYPCFPGDVAALQASGAQVVLFSPLHDSHLPEGCQGVYLGGATVLPNLCRRLAANSSMRTAIRAFCTAGGVLFAQSAGLTYLSRCATLDEDTGAQVPMADVLPFRAVLHSAYSQPTEAYVQLSLAPAACQLLAARSTQDNDSDSSTTTSPPPIHAYLYSGVNLVEELAHSLGPVGQQGRQQPAYSSAFNARSASCPPATTKQFESATSDTCTSPASDTGWPAGYCVHSVIASCMHWPLDAYPDLLDSWVAACERVDSKAVHAAVTKAVDGWLKASAFTHDRHVHFSTAPQLHDLGMSQAVLQAAGAEQLWHQRPAHASLKGVSEAEHVMSSTDSTDQQLPGWLHHVRHSQSGADMKMQQEAHVWPRVSLSGQLVQAQAMDGLSRVGSNSSIHSTTCTGCVGHGAATCSPRTCTQHTATLARNLTADLQLLEQHAGSVDPAGGRRLVRPTSLQEMSPRRQQQQQVPRAGGGAQVVAAPGHQGLPPLPAHTARSARFSLGDVRSLSVCSYDVQQMRRQNGVSMDQGVAELQEAQGLSAACRPLVSAGGAAGGTGQAGPGKVWTMARFLRPQPPASAHMQPGAVWAAPPATASAYQQAGVDCIAECDEGAGQGSAHLLPALHSHPPAFTPSFRTPVPSAGDLHALHALHAPASTRSSTELVASQLHQGHPAKVYCRSGSSASLTGGGEGQQAYSVSLTAYPPSLPYQQPGAVPYWLGSSVGCSDGIISLCPGATEVLVFMGLAGRLVGISDACDWPAQLKTVLPYACQHYSSGKALDQARAQQGSSVWRSPSSVQLDTATQGEAKLLVDEDLLREERPALVVLPHLCRLPASDQHALQRAVQRTVLSPSNPLDRGIVLEHACHTLNDVLESILQMGDITGAPQAAGLLVDRLRARLRSAASMAATRSSPAPRVLVLTALKPTIMCAGDWLPEMLSLTGASQASMHNHMSKLSAGAMASVPLLPREPGEPDVPLSWEQVVALAPEVLVIAGGGDATSLSQVADLAALPGWWSLPAVLAGAVYSVDRALLTRPGPRLVDGVEVLSSIVQQHEKQARAGQCLPPQPIQPAPGTWRTHTTHAPTPKSSACPLPGGITARAADAAQPSTTSSGEDATSSPVVLKLSLWGGQRCRPSLLPKYFTAWPPTSPAS